MRGGYAPASSRCRPITGSTAITTTHPDRRRHLPAGRKGLLDRRDGLPPDGHRAAVPAARTLALKVKRALRDQVGECLTCSIGLAPTVFLGKVGFDLQRPDGLVVITDGLVVITKDDLPEVLLGLELQEI